MQSDRLTAALADLAKKRGSPQDWLRRENLVTGFVAGVHERVHVFCRGAVYLDKGHFPAVLTYNSIYKQTLAWAPSGKKDAMEAHHAGFFRSNIPHVGIAREVLSRPETTAQVDTHPQGGDAKQAPGESLSSPVGAADAPETPGLTPPTKEHTQ